MVAFTCSESGMNDVLHLVVPKIAVVAAVFERLWQMCGRGGRRCAGGGANTLPPAGEGLHLLLETAAFNMHVFPCRIGMVPAQENQETSDFSKRQSC